MTEDRWLVDAHLEPRTMLRFLATGPVSDRKLRLFACASARAAWDLFSADARSAIEAAEDYAVGIGGDVERGLAARTFLTGIGGTTLDVPPGEPPGYDVGTARLTRLALIPLVLLMRDDERLVRGDVELPPFAGLGPSAPRPAYTRASLVSDDVATELAWRLQTKGLGWRVHKVLSVIVGGLVVGDWAGDRSIDGTYFRHPHARQRELIREVFGNPFHPVTADPSWVTSTARGLAEGIYADRAFDRLPILADALEDAGCDDLDILAHCRGDGPHVRGCWVVDLILGTERR